MKETKLDPKLKCYPGCCVTGCNKYENKLKLQEYALKKQKEMSKNK